MRTYAIGDIHGHLDKLHAVHGWIDRDKAQTGDAQAPVVHVGDLVDRGPDVPGVLDFLIAGQAAGAPWVVLKGNHDRMMWHFLQAPPQPDPLRDDLHWLQDNIGGRQTLAGYGIDVSRKRRAEEIHAEARAVVPQAHMTLLGGLPTHFRLDSVYYCHAGIRPGVPLADQAEDDLVWIRGEFHNDRRDHGALIVHGHTPVDEVTHYGNRLNLDTGAAYGGPLSAVVIEDGTVWKITAAGRVHIRA
ncbi:metallophosphoesterase [Actibacterium sp. D379-3]